MTMIIGDFNSKVGKQTPADINVMGPWCYGKRNERGKRLIELCFEHELHIMNTYFKKNLKQKWTWLSPDGKTKNEIDFILVKNRASVLDIQIITTSFSTDHRLVRAKIGLQKPRKARQHFKSKTHTLNPLEQVLLVKTFKTRIENMNINFTNISEDYKHFIDAINSSKIGINCGKKDKHKQIIDGEISKLINERTQLKNKITKTKADKRRVTVLYKKINKKNNKNNKKYKYKILEEELRKTGSIKRRDRIINNKKQWIVEMKNKNNLSCTNRHELLKIASDFYEELYGSEIH